MKDMIFNTLWVVFCVYSFITFTKTETYLGFMKGLMGE